MASEFWSAFSSQITQADPSYVKIAGYLGIPIGALLTIMIFISIWALVWKGFALWKSAKKNSMIWFIVLLVVNTVGILEILYIFVFSKIGEKREGKKKKL